MIKLAVFDLDGTLVDSLTDLALSVNKGLKRRVCPSTRSRNTISLSATAERC